MDRQNIPVEEQIERLRLKVSYLKTALHDLFQLVIENEIYWVEALRREGQIQSVERAQSSTLKAAPTDRSVNSHTQP